MKRLFPLCLFLIALSWFVNACSKPPAVPQPTPEQKAVAAKALFAKQLAQCVDDNHSDYDTEMCICATAARWGKDAGVCQ